MFKRDQNGSAVAIAAISVLSLLVVGLAIFAFSAYSTGQDYKNNSDQKAAQAVEKAKAEQEKQLQAKFDEEYKKPNTSYKGPASFGSVAFDYPKTWSAYVIEGDGQPINGYFHPSVVPGIDSGAAYALRLEIVDLPYSQVVEEYNSLISSGQLTAKAYIPPKMEGNTGVQPGLRLDGEVDQGESPKRGSLVIIQVRDKTLKIYTQSENFLNDFNNTILPTLTFSP